MEKIQLDSFYGKQADELITAEEAKEVVKLTKATKKELLPKLLEVEKSISSLKKLREKIMIEMELKDIKPFRPGDCIHLNLWYGFEQRDLIGLLEAGIKNDVPTLYIRPIKKDGELSFHHYVIPMTQYKSVERAELPGNYTKGL